MLLRLFFLLITVSAFCEDTPQAPLLASIETEPSGIVDGCVNVISGSFFEHAVDLVVPGPEPLKIERLLVNNNQRPTMGGLSNVHPEWKFNDVQYFNVNRKVHELSKKRNHYDYRCNYHGKLGEALNFRYYSGSDDPIDKDIGLDFAFLKLSHTNTSHGVIGAQTNIRNNIIKYYESVISLDTSNGSTSRFFDIHGQRITYFLDEEISPNYLKKKCVYKHGYELAEYSLKNWGDRTLSTLTRQDVDTGAFREITYKAPDGRSTLYRFVKDVKESSPYAGCMNNRLHEVIRSDKPSILYVYQPSRTEDVHYSNNSGYKRYHVHDQMIARYYPESRYIIMDYYMRESINPEKKVNIRTEYSVAKEVEYNVEEELDNANPEIGRIKAIRAPVGADAAPIQKYRFQYHLIEGGGGCTGVYDARNRKTDYGYNNRGRLTDVVKFYAIGTPYTAETIYWGPQDTHKEIELSARSFGLVNSPYKAFSKAYHYDVEGNAICEVLSGNLTGKSEISTLMVDVNGYAIPGTADSLTKWHEYSADKYHLLTKTTVGTKTTRNVFIPNTNLLAACYHADAGKTYLRHFYFYNDTGMVIKHLIDDGINDNVHDLTGVTERKIELIERTDSYPVGYPLVTTELCLDVKTGQEHLLGRKVNTYDKSGRLLQEDTYGNDDLLAFSRSWEYDAHGNVTKEVRPDGAVTLRSYDANDNMISETGPNPLLTKTFTYDFMNRLIQVEEHHPDIRADA